MAVKKPNAKKATAKSAAAPMTHTQVSRLVKKHFPKVKAAAEKALRESGLHGIDVNHMMFSADLADDPCGGCGPGETCMLSSTGRFVCVPNN